MASINYKKFEKMMKDQMQASSTKRRKLQAPSSVNHEEQASSPKHKASSFKPEATSSRTTDPE